MKKIVSMLAITLVIGSLTGCPATPTGVTAANDLVKQMECAVSKSGVTGEQKAQVDAALASLKASIQAAQAAGAAGDAILKKAVDSVPKELKDIMKALGC